MKRLRRRDKLYGSVEEATEAAKDLNDRERQKAHGLGDHSGWRWAVEHDSRIFDEPGGVVGPEPPPDDEPYYILAARKYYLTDQGEYMVMPSVIRKERLETIAMVPAALLGILGSMSVVVIAFFSLFERSYLPPAAATGMFGLICGLCVAAIVYLGQGEKIPLDEKYGSEALPYGAWVERTWWMHTTVTDSGG